MSTLDFVDEELAALERRGRRRGVRVVDGRRGAAIALDGRWVVNFSSNDYLGLADDPALVAAATAAMAVHGVGAGASRLITGTSDEVVALEQELARFHGAPSALVFGSGYAANTGVIPALVGRGDEVFSDERNHASIIDGCRLARAEVRVWRHGDVADLGRLLAAARGRRRLVVTESVFSMDGDRAPLAELRRLADLHGAMMLVDDAHAVGVSGPDGRGYGVSAGAELVIGTFGKAFGTAGAYVLGSEKITQYLWNRSRSLVFSTAMPPAIAAATRAALAIVSGAEGTARRAALAANLERLRAGLAALGLGCPGSGAPIVPVIIGEDRGAVACTEALLEDGLLVQAIRPPTVPEGSARLRIALGAIHRSEEIDRLLTGLGRLRRLGRIPD